MADMRAREIQIVDRLVEAMARIPEENFQDFLVVIQHLLDLNINRTNAMRRQAPIIPARQAPITPEDREIFEKEVERAIKYITDGIWNTQRAELVNGILKQGSLIRRRLSDEIYQSYINTHTGNLFDNNAWISTARTFLPQRLPRIHSIIQDILQSALAKRTH
jgi:hypothetical protein